jgi:hypothetical protein
MIPSFQLCISVERTGTEDTIGLGMIGCFDWPHLIDKKIVLKRK